jgi:hypothetical protein
MHTELFTEKSGGKTALQTLRYISEDNIKMSLKEILCIRFGLDSSEFHKRHSISWLAEWLFVSQEGIYSADLTSYLAEILCDIKAWIQPAQDRLRWRVLGNEPRVPYNAANFLTSWATASFSGRTFLHGVR